MALINLAWAALTVSLEALSQYPRAIEGFERQGSGSSGVEIAVAVQLARRQSLKCLNYSTWAPAGFLSQSVTLSPAGGSRQTQRARVPCAPVLKAGARRADELTS